MAEQGPPSSSHLARSARAPGGWPFQPLSTPLLARSQRDGERGAAVVEFVFVSVLVVVLLLAVLQVAVYVHVRNVVTASAQEGARFAANADVPSSAGADRTVAVVARATSPRTADGLVCTSAEEVDASGLTLVVVRCSGAVPTLLAGLGSLLPVEVTGRAVEEAQ